MTDINEYLTSDRKNFSQNGLSEDMLPDDPAKLFEEWLKQAIARNNPEPYAFAVLSRDEDGFPAGRMVYLRALEDDGTMVFFTNYTSDKAKQVEREGKLGALFFWPMSERQVRISGLVERAPEEMSDAYFASRPRRSQLGAWASIQSAKLESREVLEEQVKAMEKRFADYTEVPRPDFWGGMLIQPQKYEFWQGRESRLHDRIRYKKVNGVWLTERLNP